jgi:hypothetical protein
MLDVLLSISQASMALALGFIGFWLTIHPATDDRQKRVYKWWFAGLSLVLAALSVWLGVRNDTAQAARDAAIKELSTLTAEIKRQGERPIEVRIPPLSVNMPTPPPATTLLARVRPAMPPATPTPTPDPRPKLLRRQLLALVDEGEQWKEESNVTLTEQKYAPAPPVHQAIEWGERVEQFLAREFDDAHVQAFRASSPTIPTQLWLTAPKFPARAPHRDVWLWLNGRVTYLRRVVEELD